MNREDLEMLTITENIQGFNERNNPPVAQTQF